MDRYPLRTVIKESESAFWPIKGEHLASGGVKCIVLWGIPRILPHLGGYRHWHADLRLDDTPLEAGLGFTCKLKSETPFLGRSALEKQKEGRAQKKRLACFTIDEHIPLWGLEVIWRDDRIVGFLRRAEYGFAIGKSIGYGYVSHPDGIVVTPDFPSPAPMFGKHGNQISCTASRKVSVRS
ncbi:sarcosine dehydrogenase, mitochondrial [Caerostris extrusa]|uniref:Sarcosine dehydrogenase, mitochondrial n=1 Tax=Caerostris extrusa TaxID=172846 RepID=A0AAV4P2B9_CAEEX|nr:sarcosine dehydrogenase, mitochondrial [Caerostris extrusa]